MPHILSILSFFFFIVSNGFAQQEYFRIIDDGKEALQCRIDLIQRAKEEILVSYYIVKDDESGLYLLDLLAEAARRGVLVRVLMDANGSEVDKDILLWLADQGVQIRKFRTRNGLRRLWHRLHDKILLADFNTMIVGGRNLKNEYFGLGKKFNFHDCDALVRSTEACHAAREHFYSIWNKTHLSRPPRYLPEPVMPVLKAAERQMEENRRKMENLFPGLRDPRRDWFAGLDTVSNPIYFVHDDFFRRDGDLMLETTQKDMGSTQAMIGLVAGARHSIVVENPYFNPPRLWRKAFKKAVRRGVNVRVLTNSARSTDVFWYYFRYLLNKRRLLRAGIKLWEWQGAEKLHTKAMVVDDAVALVGSYNLHLNSQRFNTEVSVWVRDSAAAAVLLSKMDAHLLRAKKQ